MAAVASRRKLTTPLAHIRRQLLDTIEQPQTPCAIFRTHTSNPSHGCLVFGPAGCGKSNLLRDVAESAEEHVVFINCCDLLTSQTWEPIAHLQELFRQARAASPALLILDDFDTAEWVREELRDRFVQHFVTEMNAMTESEEVVRVIIAANRPDLISGTILQTGRVDSLLYIGLPTLQSRMAVIQAGMEDPELLADAEVEVDHSELAERTEGCSISDILTLCMCARMDILRKAILEKRLEGTSNNRSGDSDGTSVNVQNDWPRITKQDVINLALHEPIRPSIDAKANKRFGDYQCEAEQQLQCVTIVCEHPCRDSNFNDQMKDADTRCA